MVEKGAKGYSKKKILDNTELHCLFGKGAAFALTPVKQLVVALLFFHNC